MVSHLERSGSVHVLNLLRQLEFQLTKPPIGEPSVSPRREGAGPPSTLGWGGASLWQQEELKRPDRAGDGRGLRV